MESEPGHAVTEVWAYLSRDEAVQLWDALNAWASEPASAGWHCHVSDADGNKLTIAVGEPDDPTFTEHAR
jgi:hypothetical protein